MKVAYATIFDPLDVRRGSGTWYHLGQEIARRGHDMTWIGPLEVDDPFATRMVRSLHRRLGKRYKRYLDPGVAKARGRQVSEQLGDAELVITNDYAIAGHTATDVPVVLYTDAMIPLDYPAGVAPDARIAGLSSWGVKRLQATVRKGLRAVSLAVYPETELADAAARYAPSAPIEIIPFGANLEDPGAIERRFDTVRAKGVIDLLFVGKEWRRKGGDVAVAVAESLWERGMPAHLHVVGTSSGDARTVSPIGAQRVSFYGLLDKAEATQRATFERLFRSADAFLLPSSSEGFVISVLEAAAYGLPVLAYDVPGVRRAVEPGVSGELLALGASADAYADVIASWFDVPARYDALARGAREHFATSVNWPRAVDRLFETIDRVIRQRSSSTSAS
ncbi:MAG: glycosyltransferase family 4 protein [Acidobacteriota bacterium]